MEPRFDRAFVVCSVVSEDLNFEHPIESLRDLREPWRTGLGEDLREGRIGQVLASPEGDRLEAQMASGPEKLVAACEKPSVCSDSRVAVVFGPRKVFERANGEDAVVRGFTGVVSPTLDVNLHARVGAVASPTRRS